MSSKPGQKSALSTEVSAQYDESFMEELDGRVRAARTLRQRLRELTNDLGGLANLSYQEQSLCKRAIHIERLIEKKELTLSHGGKVDEQGYYSALTTLSSLFSKIGYRRRPKVVGTLAEVLSQQESAS
jgi:hypothetical protein